jgi:hypothetical protein
VAHEKTRLVRERISQVDAAAIPFGRGMLERDTKTIVPVEVKSSRNVRARTLATFVRHAHSPYAIVLSENDFGRGVSANDIEMRHIPPYAAHCMGNGFAKVDA